MNQCNAILNQILENFNRIYRDTIRVSNRKFIFFPNRIKLELEKFQIGIISTLQGHSRVSKLKKKFFSKSVKNCMQIKELSLSEWIVPFDGRERSIVLSWVICDQQTFQSAFKNGKSIHLKVEHFKNHPYHQDTYGILRA